MQTKITIRVLIDDMLDEIVIYNPAGWSWSPGWAHMGQGIELTELQIINHQDGIYAFQKKHLVDLITEQVNE